MTEGVRTNKTIKQPLVNVSNDSVWSEAPLMCLYPLSVFKLYTWTRRQNVQQQFFTRQRHLPIFSTNLSIRPPTCKSPFTLNLTSLGSLPSFWSTFMTSSHDVSVCSAALIMALVWRDRGVTVPRLLPVEQIYTFRVSFPVSLQGYRNSEVHQPPLSQYIYK